MPCRSACCSPRSWRTRRRDRGSPTSCASRSALALAFAAVGVYQVLRHDVWWNRKLMVSNAFSSFFRANSVFYDPSIFGRYLAVTITLVFAALLFGTVRRPLLAAVAAALAWVGILTSYSQSAFVALCAAVGAGLILAFGRRLAALLLVAAVLVGLGDRRRALGAPLGRRPRHLGALAARRRRPPAVPRAPARRRGARRVDRRRARSRPSAGATCAAPST